MKTMHVGKISPNDMGRWFLTNDEEEVKLIGFVGNLLRCKTDKGIVLITVFDILKPISHRVGKENQPEPVKKERKPSNRGAANRKAVVATDCYGNKRRYVSLMEAAKEVDIHISSISRALKKNAVVKGFTWRYESSSLPASE